MKLERWAYIATITEVILIAASILVILRELNLNREVAKAANATALTEQALVFNQTLWQDGEVADLWYSMGNNLKNETAIRQYREMLVTWLIVHENAFYQHQAGFIDADHYSGWRLDLENTIEAHNIDSVARDFNAVFAGAYGKHLETLIVKRNKDGEVR